MSRSFKAARVRAIHTVSLEMMLAYVITAGASVMCPPAPSHALHQKLLSLISKIM